jgi:ABC-type protease/lipase transport system fused ATPase/permease subunit
MSNLNERDVAMLVRDALRVYFEQQAAAANAGTLIAELEAEAGAGMRTIQSLVDDMARQRRVWLANDMHTLLADPAAAFAGSYTRERWLEIQALFDAFGAWLATPLAIVEGVMVAPLVIISRRNNPSPAWGIVAPEEEPDGEI